MWFPTSIRFLIFVVSSAIVLHTFLTTSLFQVPPLFSLLSVSADCTEDGDCNEVISDELEPSEEAATITEEEVVPTEDPLYTPVPVDEVVTQTPLSNDRDEEEDDFDSNGQVFMFRLDRDLTVDDPLDDGGGDSPGFVEERPLQRRVGEQNERCTYTVNELKCTPAGLERAVIGSSCGGDEITNEYPSSRCVIGNTSPGISEIGSPGVGSPYCDSGINDPQVFERCVQEVAGRSIEPITGKPLKDALICTMRAEVPSLDPGKVGPCAEVGLFQFLAATWKEMSTTAGEFREQTDSGSALGGWKVPGRDPERINPNVCAAGVITWPAYYKSNNDGDAYNPFAQIKTAKEAFQKSLATRWSTWDNPKYGVCKKKLLNQR